MNLSVLPVSILQTGQWEPVDGYAVDMSGFGPDVSESGSDKSSGRRGAASHGAGASGGAVVGSPSLVRRTR